MWRLSWFKYKEITKKLQSFWFSFYRDGKWSHKIWNNKQTGLYTTIPKHSWDLPEWTLRAILKQASVDVEDFLER